MILLTLTEDEVAWANDVGSRRHTMDIEAGYKEKYGDTGQPEELDKLGACGELLAHLWFRVPWPAYVGKDMGTPDLVYRGQEFEARTRSKAHYELPVRESEKDLPGRILILIVRMMGRETHYGLVGWVESDVARALAVPRDLKVGRGKQWFVPQDRLYPFDGRPGVRL